MTPEGCESELHVKPSSISTRTSLVVGLKAISQERWLEFVQVYSPLIRYWVCRDSVPDSALEDVVQECLASFYTSISSFERQPTKKFRGWLRTIVKRRVADHFRGNSKDPMRFLDELNDFPDTLENDAPEESPEEQTAYREAALRACEIVRQTVAEKTWSMFWQSVVEQRPTAEIAREFNTSADNVRVAKYRVLNKLKDLAVEELDLNE